ncbi:entry exclusion lipoprotein TrbK [Xylophilus ampelinus]|uniref:Entry exclusion lipoprotein TrbK n=1 Tax=Xylophilus ampelinus TaxID=54067 RepID=A0A318SU72_9BURK|nr:entry exclusion lipoprotein TrbK [Xylophilus ampelinus]MCS4511834.1 entry exclusion lipoprotein TrbK [Xylophilus ampelinus]PYE73360.1 entry exclusion lipoprotein TrbK [Xylophilus ampelinus]
MKTNKALALALAALVAALVAGCDNKPKPAATVAMPEVNDKNCKPGNVAKVDASVRQQFADACARRGSFKPSTGRTW